MSRGVPARFKPTHVVVFGIDAEGNKADWLMPLEEFAKLFTYGPTYKMGPNGPEGMSQDILVRASSPGDGE